MAGLPSLFPIGAAIFGESDIQMQSSVVRPVPACSRTSHPGLPPKYPDAAPELAHRFLHSPRQGRAARQRPHWLEILRKPSGRRSEARGATPPTGTSYSHLL